MQRGFLSTDCHVGAEQLEYFTLERTPWCARHAARIVSITSSFSMGRSLTQRTALIAAMSCSSGLASRSRRAVITISRMILRQEEELPATRRAELFASFACQNSTADSSK